MSEKLWVKEHGIQYAVPAEIEALVESEGWADQSWHNDINPSFAKPIAGFSLTIWVAHPNPEERESPECARFIVDVSPEGEAEALAIYIGDDLAEVLATVRRIEDANKPL